MSEAIADYWLGSPRHSFGNILTSSSSSSPVKVTSSPFKAASVKAALNFEDTGASLLFSSTPKVDRCLASSCVQRHTQSFQDV
jgi:hypothetical protein